jgi:probable HAF family extracellular repeat protein
MTTYTFSPLTDSSGAIILSSFGTMGINNSGAIAGSYIPNSGDNAGYQDGFLYNGGSFISLTDPSSLPNPGSETGAEGVNDSGTVVGYYVNPSNDSAVSFIYSGGTFTDLPAPSGTAPLSAEAMDINNAGQIVGFYQSQSPNHGFLYKGGVYTTLDDPSAGPSGTIAYGINNNGQIVGTYSDSQGLAHGFLYTISTGTFVTLDDPSAGSGGQTFARGINDSGQVVGYFIANGGGSHGFIESGGVYTTIDDPAGTNTELFDINNSGQITGDIIGGVFIATSPSNGLLGALSLDQQTELIYIGYFNRSADGGGFAFWEGQDAHAQASVSSGGFGQSAAVALTNIANSFTPQAETIAIYPFLSNPSPNYSDPTVQAGLMTFIENVYGNLFDHVADSGGLAYWTGQIESGAVGLGAAVLAIANGAQGSDATILQNKITVALDFTNLTTAANVPTTAALVAEAKTVLAGVDGVSLNDASVTAAEAMIAPWIASHPHGALVALVGSATSLSHALLG